MQGRWFKAGWVALCLAVSVPAFATTYTIYPDGTFTPNSKCSLTQAFQAINTQQSLIKVGNSTSWIATTPAATDVVICAAGTGTNIINLFPQDENYYSTYKVVGVTTSAEQTALAKWLSTFSSYAAYQAADVYQLPQQMEVGGQGNNVALSIQIFRGVFDKTIYGNAIVNAAPNQRAFFVHTSNSLSLTSISLTGSDVHTQAETPSAVPPTSHNGGVIYAQGNITLTAGSVIAGGQAQNGGGIYLDGTNLSLNFTNAFISNNVATVNGGGVGLSASSTATITGSQFNLFSNSATNGGAIYLGGQVAIMSLSSGTLYDNRASGGSPSYGSAIDFAAGYAPGSVRASSLNNLTVIDNTGVPALHYWDICQHVTSGICDLYAPPGAATDPNNVTTTWVPNPSLRYDWLYNSVVVGNAGAGCSMKFDPSNTTSSLSQYVENAYSVTSDAGAGSTVGQTTGCPAAEQMLQSGNGDGTINPTNPANNAAISILSGVMIDGSSCVMGSAGCSFLDFGEQHYHLQGALPTGFDANNPVYPTLVNAASPDSATTQYLCSSTDERSATRADTCDVGAVELTIAMGTTDNFDTIVTGQPIWLDVVKNDLGDGSIDCNNVSPAPCISFPQLPQYGGTVTVVYATGPLPNKIDGTPVYSTTTDPGTQATADVTHFYPLLLYVSAAGFHGEDTFLYQVPTAVVPGATYGGLPLSAQVNLAVAPVDNFPNKNITNYHMGGVGMWMLLGLLLLGFSRKGWLGKSVTVVLLLAGMSAQANTITVNSLDDPTDLTAAYNDGKCTLREALQRSFDNYPDADKDCAPGAPGTDTIILPGPASVPPVPGCTATECVITLNSALNIRENNSVIIQGAGVDKTFIDGAGQFRILTQSPLSLQYLTFRNGAATSGTGQGLQGGAVFTNSDLALDHAAIINSVAADLGGAIYLSYGSNVGHALSISSSYIKGNQATNGGGAIYTVGQNQQLQLTIDSSTFDSNTTTNGKGGAIDANLAKGGGLSIINSIFTANVSPASSAAIDLSDANLSTTINFLNSTFYNNTGGSFLDVGNNTNVVMSNSIVAGNTISCSSGTGVLRSDNYNLYTPSEPATCGSSPNAVSALLTDVTTALNNGALTPATGSTSDYLPPLFTVVPTSLIIVDQGNPGGLGSGIFSPALCRAVDMRGKSRLSGAHCDIGAFEVQTITALDDALATDTGHNDGTPETDRQGRVDVLANDLPSDGATIQTGTIGFLVSGAATRLGFLATGALSGLPSAGTLVQIKDITGGTYTDNSINLTLPAVTPPIPPAVSPAIQGTLKWVQKKSGDPVCAAGDDCGLLFDMTCDDLAVSTGFTNCGDLRTAISTDITNGNTAIISAHDPNNLVCPNSNTPAIKIPYVAYDTNNNIAYGTLSVGLKDVPPQFSQGIINVYTNPDQDVNIPLPVSDPDGVITNFSMAQNGDPEFAKQNGSLDPNNPSFHPSWGVGVIWNGSLTTPVITYKHANVTQVFNDTFKIQATDNCGAVSTVTININFPQTGDNGSSILHGGSLGWGLGLLLCLGLTRRRYMD